MGSPRTQACGQRECFRLTHRVWARVISWCDRWLNLLTSTLLHIYYTVFWILPLPVTVCDSLTRCFRLWKTTTIKVIWFNHIKQMLVEASTWISGETFQEEDFKAGCCYSTLRLTWMMRTFTPKCLESRGFNVWHIYKQIWQNGIRPDGIFDLKPPNRSKVHLGVYF